MRSLLLFVSLVWSMDTMATQIDEKHQLQINDSEQWIFARGNSNGPILFFVHGGPGFPFTPLARAFEEPYKKDYLVIHWDQRGLGKSYKSTDFSRGFNLKQFVSDGLAIAEEIRRRYSSRPLILVAHSWGTVLGARMVAQAPQLFDAYVSIGTNSDSLEIERYRYEALAKKLLKEGKSEDLASLEKLGPPPIAPVNFNVVADLFVKHIPFSWTWGPITRNQVEAAISSCVEAGDYTADELEDTFVKAMPQSIELLHNDYIEFSALRAVPQIDIPVYFVQGQLDFNTPSTIAKKYFNSLIAPKEKHWLELEDHGHMVMYEDPKKVIAILEKIVARL